MEAIPLARVVERQEEQVRAGERVEQLRGAFLFEQRVAQRAAQAIEDRGTEHELLRRRIVCLEHLVDEEVDDVAVPAAESAHQRAPVVGRLQRERREVDAGRPALRSLDEILDVGALEPELQTVVQEASASAGVKPRSAARSSSSAPCARSARQGESRLVARCEDELERRGSAVDEPRDAVARGAAREPVEVVEDQGGIADCRQLVDQLRAGTPPAIRACSEHLRRRAHVAGPGRRDGAPRARSTTARRVVVALVEAQPRDRLRRFLALAPRAQERRLAVAGRRGDDRQLDTGARA